MAKKSVLQVVDHRRGYAIAWVEDGEEGAYIGEFKGMTEKESRKGRDARECYLAELVVSQIKSGHQYVAGHLYVWERKSDAEAVRKAINAALKADAETMPEWAAKALAEGWKPPKGWKP